MTPTAELNDVAVGACRPVAPRTLAEAGLSQDLVLQLVLEELHFAGELTGTRARRRLGLAFSVIEPALELLKRSGTARSSAAR